MIPCRPIISAYTEPIFIKVSPNGRYLIVDDQSEPLLGNCGWRNTMVTSYFRPEVERWPFRACAVKIMQHIDERPKFPRHVAFLFTTNSVVTSNCGFS